MHILTLAILLAQDPKPQPEVTKSVNRAVDWFDARYADVDMGSRDDLVAALALLHAEGPKRHKRLAERIAAFLKAADVRAMATYDLGILAMICESLADARWVPLLRSAIQRLVDMQGEDGSWGYGVETPEDAPSTDKTEDAPKTKSKRIRIAGGHPIGEAKPVQGLKRRTEWSQGESAGDHSVSQYAVLGLFAGHRSGVTVDAEVWKRARKFFLDTQNEDGGWGYRGDEHKESYGSMTCAGVASVAIASFALGDQDWKDQPAVRKGLEWLARNFTVEKNPGEDVQWHFYYLYGLERVGRILDIESIGSHEWFALGAKELLSKQREDGSWFSEPDTNEVLSTSFALLFLTRATASLKVPEKKTGPGTLVTALQGGAGGGKTFHVILDASGSMGAPMDGKKKFVIAQDAVCSIIESLPDGCRVGLRVYGHHKKDGRTDPATDSELLIPIRKLDKKAFTAAVKKLDYNGDTPLTYSLKQSVKDITEPGDDPVTVILLTDGAESTRGADPVAAARDLVSSRPGTVLHVVAFDVNDAPSKKQMEEMAKAGGGICCPAKSAAELVEKLKQVFAPSKLAYELFDANAKKVADGEFGDRRPLAEGKYRIQGTILGESFDETLWVNAGETTTVTADVSP